MKRKPNIWTALEKDDENINKTQYEDGYVFPCSEKCLVAPSCKLYCYKVFNYMNFIADKINIMTADQLQTYRGSTPFIIKRKIQEFYTYDKRLAYPETAIVSREDGRWK